MKCNLCLEDNIDQKHMDECLKKQIIQYKSLSNSKSLSDDQYGIKELTPKQIKALTYCKKKSKVFSNNVYGNLLISFINKGLSEDELKHTLNYIKDKAQITINFKMEILGKALSEDIKYKSTFEVNNIKEFSARQQWEDKLFNRIYDKDTEPFERVKYGALNILDHPCGLEICKCYGDSFIVLKSHIKQRSTFTLGDSSKMEIHLCMADNFCNILLYLDDVNLLNDVINVATGKTKFGNYMGEYIECQIHGNILYHRDVEKICINSRHKTDSAMVHYLEEFRLMNKVPYEWI